MCRSSVAARYCVRAAMCVRKSVCLYVPAVAVVSVRPRGPRLAVLFVDTLCIFEGIKNYKMNFITWLLFVQSNVCYIPSLAESKADTGHFNVNTLKVQAPRRLF